MNLVCPRIHDALFWVFGVGMFHALQKSIADKIPVSKLITKKQLTKLIIKCLDHSRVLPGPDTKTRATTQSMGDNQLRSERPSRRSACPLIAHTSKVRDRKAESTAHCMRIEKKMKAGGLLELDTYDQDG